MNLKTLFLDNPKTTNVLIILLVAFNLLFVIGWCASSHHNHRHYHRMHRRGNYGGMGFHHGYSEMRGRGDFGGGYGRFGEEMGFHHHRRFRHHHNEFGYHGGFGRFQGMGGNYTRHDWSNNLHGHGDSAMHGYRGWDKGNYHAQADSTRHHHGFKHWRQQG